MLRRAPLIASLAGLSHQAPHRAAGNQTLAPLKFNEHGTFQIAVFSDLHFGQRPSLPSSHVRHVADTGADESSTGGEQDRNSVRVIRDVLDFDPPNLVVLNGDLINGESTCLENSTHYIDQIVSPMVERNLSWASTYGNHDRRYNIHGDGILKREHMWRGARTQKMVSATDAGTTNYYLPVYAASCTDDSTCAPELLLWFFDSRGGLYFQGEDQPSWVDEGVVTWFNQTNAALVKKHQKVLPSLVFVHIPINATEALRTESKGGVRQHYQPGINEDDDTAQQGAGWCSDGVVDETCVYGGQDGPFMRALVTMPGIVALFYGHDHGNTWCYKWDAQLAGMAVAGNGINLCYGQHSGYGGYGDWIRGAREIVVSQEKLKDFAVDTHIRLESGRVVGAVSLNSTFNKDYYPATPDEKTYMGHTENGKVKVYDESGTGLRTGCAPSAGGLRAVAAWAIMEWTLRVLYP
ncbi:Uncharacterized protein TPAR_03954 [Tolypocladium paradoxum]|uniref:Calcineurin-like phosphoesterase domain-containing protein n=1 Tax=Tolypocladium paradoxum TaxID=94208 RepID=A0A2S4L090_9HYPO|nr:Uncharacterized protein TPAR_03954 [Tolypocladium paradoxum]